MKKTFLFLLVAGLAMAFTSCNSCKKSEQETPKVDSVLVVEELCKADAEQMNKEFSTDYRWYETCVVNAEFFDGEKAAEPVVVGVSNIYQYLLDVQEHSADVRVVLFAHVKDSTMVDVRQDFWIGDMPMTNDMVKLSYAEAYKKMMGANFTKPHSKQCVLRKEVGPNECNPQYIFGNTEAQLYVDAVTGEVTDKNPVYKGFESKLKKPLGEWP